MSKKCGTAYGHRSDGCWFITFGVSCGCRAGVTDKILTRENIYACVFIYTRQASVVKEVLWTDSLRRRIMFTQLGSVLFLIHSPYGAYARSRWTALQPTANLYSLLCGACLLTNGPKERSKESPVRASQHCAAAAIWGDNGGEESKTQRGEDRGTERRRCSQNIPLKSSLKKLKLHRLSLCNRHSINSCQNIL